VADLTSDSHINACASAAALQDLTERRRLQALVRPLESQNGHPCMPGRLLLERMGQCEQLLLSKVWCAHLKTDR
jgi:hypothetical protein